MRRQRALLAATTLAVAVAACTPARQPEPASTTTTSAGPVVASFVGEIPGSKAVVAVVANRDGVAVAFVCDGRRLAERFRGRLAANHADLASDRGARLQVMVTPAAARGMFTSPGQRPLGFAAALAVGAAGYWQGQGTVAGRRYHVGLVVLNDGRQRGAVTDLASGTIRPAPPANPADFNQQISLPVPVAGGHVMVRWVAA